MFIFKELMRLVKDEDGLTTVEYAVAGALVAAAVVGAFSSLGDAVTNRVSGLATTVNTGS